MQKVLYRGEGVWPLRYCKFCAFMDGQGARTIAESHGPPYKPTIHVWHLDDRNLTIKYEAANTDHYDQITITALGNPKDIKKSGRDILNAAKKSNLPQNELTIDELLDGMKEFDRQMRNGKNYVILGASPPRNPSKN